MERTLAAVNYILQYEWTWLRGGSVVIGVLSLLSVPFGLLNVLLGVPLILISLFLGICFRFCKDATENGLKWNYENTNVKYAPNLEKGTSGNAEKSSTMREPRQKMDMRITGSSIIDETLHEMIDYILRDYIHMWYDHITDDDEFVHELRKTIKDALVTLSSRIKDVNWIPYLTTDLVDDAASHLRLYRQTLSKLKDNPNNDLISVFFDLEASMEKNLCRDMVCTDDSHLNDYFQGLSEVLLYLLLPQETYACSPVGSLAQDLLVNHVLMPLLHLVADPDFINQCIIWLCEGFPVTPDIFMIVLRTSDTMDELFATQDFFVQQITEIKKNMNTAVGEEQNLLKQQLKCLGYVKRAIELQISHLKEGKHGDWADDTDGEDWQHYFMTGMKLHALTLEEVLKNSVSLSYFLDFMSSVGGNHYLLMFLNADAWRLSAESQLNVIEASLQSNKAGKDQTKNSQAMLDCMRDAALNIYEQFISEKAVPRVKLPESVIKRFYIQLKTETISADLFDDIQRSLIEKMQTTEKFFPAFTKNKSYIKCLLELDLLKAESVDDTVSAHSASSASDEEEDLVYDLLNEGDVIDAKTCNQKPIVESDVEFQTCRECLKMKMQSSGIRSEDLLIWEKNTWQKKYKLTVDIIEAALTVEKGKTYGIYVLLATRTDDNKNAKVNKDAEKKWHIYRRYSDFYDFHQWIKSKWMRLNKVEFPSKQTFGKTDRAFLEKRMASLNKYLSSILSMTSEPCFGESLEDSLLHFLEPGPYVARKKHFSEKIDSLVNMTVNPLKQSVKTVTQAVKTMPDTLFNTVDGFTKIFQGRPESDFVEAMKVGASIDTEDDNIPLRIVLLLMDEVFDLKSRNQWLRRKIVVVIRQVIKTMMGDNLNRRILDYVAHLTGPVKVASYLRNLQQALWPNGHKISPGTPRSPDTKLKTRVAAKASMLSSLSDELKHLIGSETTRRGLLCVFDLCQNQVLNQRLILVLVEGIIKTLYPEKPFAGLFQRLHFRSSRVGKNRPFLVPSKVTLKTSTMPVGNLSPRGPRKRKS